MLRLNIRHQLPQIGLRIQHSTLDKATTTPARVSVNNEQAKSNKRATQMSSSSESYESQYVTGRRTMLDYARERGRQGLSDVQKATSRKTQTAWSRLDNGAKRGDDIAAYLRNHIFEGYEAEPVFSLQWTKGATVQVEPSQVVGESERGDVTADIQAGAISADIRTTQGGVQTYIRDQGFLRQWVTEDYYDIYA